jgi:hypothetical protein
LCEVIFIIDIQTCRGGEQKPQYGLMTLAYKRFTAVLLLIYGSLFMSGVYYCMGVFWCAVARMLKFLVKLGKSGSEIREMLVQVCGDNAMKKTAIYKWVTRFSEGRASLMKRDQDGQQLVELKKTLQKFVKLSVKIVDLLSGA